MEEMKSVSIINKSNSTYRRYGEVLGKYLNSEEIVIEKFD